MARRRLTVDMDNPIATARCDYSGFMFPRTEMIRQMEYKGQELVWTGFMVAKQFADKPNPALIEKPLRPDPSRVYIFTPDDRADPSTIITEGYGIATVSSLLVQGFHQ